MGLRFSVVCAVSIAVSLLFLEQSVVGQADSGAAAIVIAHRGSSGYVAEHTEAAKVLAIAQGADYVEQDLVLSKDRQLVIAHDIHLDANTNASELFPDRRRDDGKFYYADFTWAELRQMSVYERTIGMAPYEARFDRRLDQRMVRLVDEVKLVQGLNRTLHRNVGLHIELKRPEWHVREFGVHPADILLPLLLDFGYSNPEHRCFIQCFEASELKYIRESGCKLQCVQLYGKSPLGLLKKTTGMEPLEEICAELSEVAKYADGIGPPLDLIASRNGDALRITPLVPAAHQAGLVVHPYTVRIDQLPNWAESSDELHRVLLQDIQVDGFFTDFPDVGRKAVDAVVYRSAQK
jgi:glycerophosphoryl diester phosphodiesterase